MNKSGCVYCHYSAENYASPVLQLGLLHLRPIQFWLKQRVTSTGLASRTPPRNGDSGLCISPGLLDGPLLAKARLDPRHGTQKEGCHDRCFQQGLGSAARGQTDIWSLVRRGVGPAHQLPRNASSVLGLSILPAGHSRTPCASMLRQQVRGVIHNTPGRPRLEATLYAGKRPSCVGSEQSALTEGDACAGQNVSSEEWTLHPLAVQSIWDVFGRA